MTSALSILRDYARYDLWATERVLTAVDPLPDAEYRRDAGLFFKSVHGTLNHLLVGQHRLWLRRFAFGESPRVDLGAEVEADRGRLRSALLDGCEAWGRLADELDESRLAGTLDYTTMRGQAVSLPYAATLLHVFNHGTHHRGQITAGLTMLGHECPVLDMVAMLQAEATARGSV
ncbi:MAG: DinB family protein [Steroidobacteraceae bacterium]